MAEEDSDRTEEATQTRRDEFRKQGQVAKSQEIISALIMVGVSLSLVVFSKFFLSNMFQLFQEIWGGNLSYYVREGHFLEAGKLAGEKTFLLLLPVFGFVLMLGVLANIVQTGFIQVEEAFTFNLEKINPIAGMGRLFGLKNSVEGLKALIKLLILTGICYLVFGKEVGKIPFLIQKTIPEISFFLSDVAFRLAFSIGVGLVGIGVLDFFFQRWELERRMKMTKEEVKQELKNQQGDPLIRARIRKLQRQAATRKMMQEVPKADVIVTNPTHIAVALKYDAGFPSPKLIAMGADHVAEKIKELAREHKIPVVENKPLARTIFKTMKIGQFIPRELFVAVAEVLSYVYKLRRKKVF